MGGEGRADEGLGGAVTGPLPLRERLHLAQRIIGEAASAVSAPDRPHSLLELEGLGAGLRHGMDAQEYVDELRREWDHRP
jgi:hypothetical protein